MIFTVLPDWYREEAKSVANYTLENGAGDKPLAQRIADAITAFENIGVTVDQLEESRSGRVSEKWTNLDVAQLQIIFESIRRGEVTVDEEFPPKRVTVGEIKQQASQPTHQQESETPPPTREGSQQWPAPTQPGSGASA